MKNISGKYLVSSDPHTENTDKIHLYLFLGEKTAKETWDSMSLQAAPNLFEINYSEKNLVILFDNKYEHTIPINVKSREIDDYIPC